MLTAEQRTSILRWMGSTPLDRQVSPAITNAMDAVDAMADAGLEAAIAAELAALANVDAQLLQSNTRQKFTRVEDVYFNVGAEAASLLASGRMHVNRLAALLGCTPERDVFGTGFQQGGRMRHG